MSKRIWNDEDLIKAIKESNTWADACRHLGLTTTGNNNKTLQRNVKRLNLSTEHFLSHSEVAKQLWKKRKFKVVPLKEILVENSNYTSTNSLKKRLYKEKLKQPICELCGQDENWRGKTMSLILDHINGVNNDNRIENLRIVCPNCNATLDTHCGKKITTPEEAEAKRKAWKEKLLQAGIKKRKTKRPPYDVLLKEIEETNYTKVGKKYGVSDNTIRKWVKFYKKYPDVNT